MVRLVRLGCVIAVGVLASVACSACAREALGGARQADDVAFIVASAGEARRLPGVEVLAATEQGLERLGVTDREGLFSVSAPALQTAKPSALLFCGEYFFCGALRADGQAFWEFREHYVELAPLAVR